MAIRQPFTTNSYFLYLEDGIPIRPMGVFNHNAMIEMNVFTTSGVEVVCVTKEKSRMVSKGRR